MYVLADDGDSCSRVIDEQSNTGENSYEWTSEKTVTIHFDFLLESFHKNRLMKALAVEEITPLYNFRQTLKLNAEKASSKDLESSFTSEDAELAEYFMSLGMDENLAYWVAYYSTALEHKNVAERKKLVNLFLEKKYTAKRQNVGRLINFTSLEIYISVALELGVAAADYVMGASNGNPEHMISAAEDLRALQRANIQLSEINTGQIQTLIELAPLTEYTTEYMTKYLKTMVALVRLEDNWIRAAQELKKLPLEDSELITLIRQTLVHSYGSELLLNKKTQIITAMVLSRYDEKVIARSMEYYHEHKRYFRTSSPYIFGAFLSILEYFKDSSDDVHISWLLSIIGIVEQQELINDVES